MRTQLFPDFWLGILALASKGLFQWIYRKVNDLLEIETFCA